jgi:hypothetical protein
MGERGPVPSDIYQTSPAHVGPALFTVGEKILMLSWAISLQGLVAICGKTLWRLAIVALLPKGTCAADKASKFSHASTVRVCRVCVVIIAND